MPEAKAEATLGETEPVTAPPLSGAEAIRGMAGVSGIGTSTLSRT